jgi:hypothetical protein
MADNEISAALAGQPVQPAAAPVTEQTATPQAQPQGNYVTSEQLNAAMDELRRTIQSSTDKSYNRVQKMIASLQKAGIQNPTEAQARAMLEMQDQSEPQNTEQGEAQPAQNSAGNPEAAQWIRANGGDPSKDFWNDIYDAAQEAGVGMITREDPEYDQYFMQDGQLRQFGKPRQFVKAFEQAFEAKKNRLAQQGQTNQPSIASSPALGGNGAKSSYRDPRKTSGISLITEGLHE